MKKLTSIILSVIMIFSIFTIVPITAKSITSSDYDYNILDDGTAIIMHYNGNDTEVTIPSTIDGYSVTVIGPGSFALTNLESVVISNGIKTINKQAFIHSTVHNISIPASVVDIQSRAFRLCGFKEIKVDSTNLYYTAENGVLFNKDKTVLLAYPIESTSVSYTIPIGVQTIEYSAFMFAGNLKSIIIPNTVTSINEEAFSYCSNLKDIEIPNSVTKIGGNAFDFSICNTENGGYYIGDCLIGADNDFCGSFSIKEGTRLVADDALRSKDSIESITVPSSVEVVGDYAFLQFRFEGEFKSINVAQSNKNFCSVDGVMFNKDKTELLYYPYGKENITYTVPNTVKKLGKVSFSDSQLESLKLPDNLKYIGESAFQYTTLKNITIPENIEYLGKCAFERSCLETIEIPSSITSIEEGCFENCRNLKSVSIKGNIKSLNDYAFNWCESLSEIDIPDSVTNIGKGAFQLTGFQKIKLPNNLENIGEYAFNNCKNLKELIIPNNEVTIRKRAFYNCPELTNVLIPNKVKKIEKSAFGYEGDIFNDYDEYCSENVINNFKIQGYSDTTAEKYANENGFTFVSLGEIPSTESTTPKLKKNSVNLKAGKTSTITVLNKGDNKATYKSSNKKIATVKDGKVTALKKGTANITVTVGKTKLTYKVTVTSSPKLNKTAKKLKVNGKFTLTVTGKAGTTTFKSNKPKIVSVSKKGVVKAKKKGTAQIIVTTNGGVKLKCKISVK
ncbi:MAG: leucine-rich repeat protein [Oscillospiraceae bacterium]|nr:leucine-rich repeat protein [Oscillospiraceae bacterium]